MQRFGFGNFSLIEEVTSASAGPDHGSRFGYGLKSLPKLSEWWKLRPADTLVKGMRGAREISFLSMRDTLAPFL